MLFLIVCLLIGLAGMVLPETGNAGAGGGEPTPGDTAPADSGDSTPDPQKAAGQTEPKDDEDGDDDPKLTKAYQEIARRTGVIKALQAKNAELAKAGRQTQPDPQTKSTESIEDYIAKLEKNDDDQVLFRGNFIHPEFVKSTLETEQQIKELSAKVEGREVSDFEGRLKAETDATMTAVEDAIRAIRAKAMPGAPPESAALLDRLMVDTCWTRIGSLMDEGHELSDKLVRQVGREVLREVVSLTGYAGQRQIADNQDYLAKFKVKPGSGEPAVPGQATLAKMSRTDRNNLVDAIAAKVDREKAAARA